MRLAMTALKRSPCHLGADVDEARRVSTPPRKRSARVTTGLKCAPETDPNARISAIRPNAVAVEFSRSWYDVVADRLDVRTIIDRQTISEFH